MQPPNTYLLSLLNPATGWDDCDYEELWYVPQGVLPADIAAKLNAYEEERIQHQKRMVAKHNELLGNRPLAFDDPKYVEYRIWYANNPNPGYPFERISPFLLARGAVRVLPAVVIRENHRGMTIYYEVDNPEEAD